MKLSIHTTITNPERRQYPWREALASYCDLADEVIVVDGGSDDGSAVSIQMDIVAGRLPKVKLIEVPWPEDYTQKEFPIHLNAGLEACTGDWAMKMDIDHIVHEKHIEGIRKILEEWPDAPFLTFGKLTVIDRYHATLKSKLPFLINRNVSPEVRYGIDETEQYNDWSWPVIPNGYFQGDTRIPIGKALQEDADKYIRAEIWNYDYFFRTKEVAKALFARCAKGYRNQTGKALWGANDEQSWAIFSHITESRKKKDMRLIGIADHPKYVRERIEKLTPEQFGFDHWKGNYQ